VFQEYSSQLRKLLFIFHNIKTELFFRPKIPESRVNFTKVFLIFAFSYAVC